MKPKDTSMGTASSWMVRKGPIRAPQHLHVLGLPARHLLRTTRRLVFAASQTAANSSMTVQITSMGGRLNTNLMSISVASKRTKTTKWEATRRKYHSSVSSVTRPSKTQLSPNAGLFCELCMLQLSHTTPRCYVWNQQTNGVQRKNGLLNWRNIELQKGMVLLISQKTLMRVQFPLLKISH